MPNICIGIRISNRTQKQPQLFRIFMRVHWECACCQCQILVLEPPYPTPHKYTHSNSETLCVSTGNERGSSTIYIVLAPAYSTLHKYAHSTAETSCVSPENLRGASAKYWPQNHYIKHYTNMPTKLHQLNVLPLGMCVVLMPNISIIISISNSTQKRSQLFRNFMRVHWECAWCQCQSLVLAPVYSTLHKYAHSTSETSYVSTENVRGASTKHWSQNHHIQHYTNTPTALHKLHACALAMCMVLVPNIGISTSIFNPTQIHPQHFRNFMRVHWECAWASTKFWSQNHHIQHYTSTPTAVQKLNQLPLGMCVVPMPNICISTSISNSTQKRPHLFRIFMRVHWKCAWCQCQILVIEPPYAILHKYAHSTSETSYVCTGNVHGASAKFWSQNHHIQHYTSTPTAIQKLYVCPLGMCEVLVPNIGISTSIFNTTQIRPQHCRNFMCVH